MTVRPRPDKSRSAAKPFSSIDAGILALARVHGDLPHGAALTSGSCSFEQLRERWREHGQVILADAVDAKAHHVEERCDWPAPDWPDRLVEQLGTPDRWPPGEKPASSLAQCATVRLVARRPERCNSRTVWRDPSGEARCPWCSQQAG